MENFNNDEIKKLLMYDLERYDTLPFKPNTFGLIKSVCYTVHLYDKGPDGQCANCDYPNDDCECGPCPSCKDGDNSRHSFVENIVKVVRSESELEDYELAKKIEEGKYAEGVYLERVNKRKELATPSIEPEKKKEKQDGGSQSVIEIPDK